MKIINYEKKKITPLNDEEKEAYENQKNLIYAKKNFVRIKIMKKNLNGCKKSEIIVIIQRNIEELLVVFAI